MCFLLLFLLHVARLALFQTEERVEVGEEGMLYAVSSQAAKMGFAHKVLKLFNIGGGT